MFNPCDLLDNKIPNLDIVGKIQENKMKSNLDKVLKDVNPKEKKRLDSKVMRIVHEWTNEFIHKL